MNALCSAWQLKREHAGSAIALRQAGMPAVCLTLAGLSLSTLLSALGSSAVNIALPTLAQNFGASFQTVQWVVLAYLLALTTLIISVSRLGDQLGRRRLLLVGIALFTLAALAAGVASSLQVVIAARALQGLGAAIMMSLSLAYVGELVPPEKVGSAMGMLGTMSAVGTALGPSLGGFLLAGPGWRALFLLNLPLGLAAFYLILRNLPLDSALPAVARRRFDLAGSLQLILTLSAYTLSMTSGRGHFGWLSTALLLLALLGGLLFVRSQSRAVTPLIQLSAFRNLQLSAGLVTSLLVSSVLMTSLIVGPFYLSLALKLEPGWVGLLMAAGPLVVALAAIPAGHLADRFGAAHIRMLGLAGIAAAALLLALLPLVLGVPAYLGLNVLLTLGYALFQTANNTSVMKSAGPAQRAVTSGLLNLSRSLGLITGTAMMGRVFATAVGSGVSTASPQALAHGLQVSYGTAAILIALAITTAVAARRMPVPER